ncbi:transcription factor C subunit 6, partial [Tremellales sp. Uapishka_1]
MVSLRERKARPSYSNIPEGLADLSASDDEDGDAGPGAGSAMDEDDSEGDLSSGDSSAFDPSGEKETKGGRDPPARSESEDDEVSDGANDEEEEEEDTKGDHISNGRSPDLVDINELPKPKSAPRSKAQPRPSLPRDAEVNSAYVHSEFNLLPLAYRDIIKDSSSVLVKGDTMDKKAVFDRIREKERERTRYWGIEGFGTGPVTPFLTRLAAKPVGRGTSKIKMLVDGNDVKERRIRAIQIAKYVNNVPPWKIWEGEGWYPELYKPGESSKVKGMPKDWRLREEIKMGYEGVGRSALSELEILSESEAAPFLPAPLGSTMTCHMGPHGKQKKVDFNMYGTQRISDINCMRDGHVFYAGGPIWGLDWCPLPEEKAADFDGRQYLALSTLSPASPRPPIGGKGPENSPASIQIWSLLPPEDRPNDAMEIDGSTEASKGSMKCEMVLCIDGGAALQLRWMPLAGWDDYDMSGPTERTAKMGILAAVQLNGSISFYPVPYPKLLQRALGEKAAEGQPLYLRLRNPSLRIETPDAAFTCIDWMSSSRIVGGLSNGENLVSEGGLLANLGYKGHVAVYDVDDALRSASQRDVLPSVYTCVAVSSIRSIAAARCPPTDSSGVVRYDWDSPFVIAASYDGSVTCTDLRDSSQPVLLNASRIPTMAVAWIGQLQSPVFVDVDYAIIMQKLRGHGGGKNQQVSLHRGPVWDLATSDYHTVLASAGADGVVQLANYQTGFFRRRGTMMLVEKIYQIDYDTHSGEYRMLDDFVPEPIPVESGMTKAQRETQNLVKTGNWLPQVGIHCVCWQSGGGIGRAGLLVSGGASGLARVDFMRGRFTGDLDLDFVTNFASQTRLILCFAVVMSRRWRLRTPTPILLLLVLLSRASAQYVSTDLGERDDSQTSTSTESFLNAHDDFCLFGPPDPFSTVVGAELNVVSWCSKTGHNTRLIPDGTLHGVTYVKMNDYVQVSGQGDFTKINIAPGDLGGQFDSQNNTPAGAVMNAGSGQAGSWVTMISADTFCVRACTGDSKYCPIDYDEMGCWFFTGNNIGNDGVWQDCSAEDGDPPGVVSGVTYTQGDSPTPTPTAPSLSNCQTGSSVANGQSPPAMQSWTGDTGSPATTASGSGDASDSGGSAASGSGTGSVGLGSTTWLPVSTCTPCSGATSSVVSDAAGSGSASMISGGSASSSAAGSALNASSGTQQYGVTQMSSGSGGVSSTSPPSALATGTSAAQAESSLNDIVLGARDGGTTTSGGQCCFTTWTPSVAGGASATPTASGSKASSGSTSRAALTGSSTALTGKISSGGVSGTAVVSGAGSTASTAAKVNTTGGTNSPNGTNSSSGAARTDIVGIEGVWRFLFSSAGVVLVGIVGGGWTVS